MLLAWEGTDMQSSQATSGSPPTDSGLDGSTTTADHTLRQATIAIGIETLASTPIPELVRMARAAGLQQFGVLARTENLLVIQLDLSERIPEASLAAADAAVWWDRLTRTPDRERYILAVPDPQDAPSLFPSEPDVFGPTNVELADRTLEITVVGTQPGIGAVFDAYERDDLNPTLRRIGSYTGSLRPLEGLTDRQREAVLTAYDLGYYEVPRQTTSERVAAQLDIDTSTLSEHLHRAERNLLSQALST